MAAILQPHQHPQQRPQAHRPDLRLVAGGRAAARRHRRARSMAVVYRRRRIGALVALAAAVLAAALVVQAIGGFLTAPAPPTAPAGPAASAMHVIEPGDTYWSIAAGLDRGGDIRSTVDELVDANGGRVLQVGDRILIPS